MSARRRRVLFVAEDVTLAQVVRLVVLARALNPARYEVHFACARFDPLIFRGTSFVCHPLFTVERRRVLRAAEAGRRLYDAPVLARYVQEEVALFREVRPDVVVGDLRFSLCVSAPYLGVPYASLINATWSRNMVRSAFPVPDHPIVRVLGEQLAARYFPRALPRVLAHFAAPVNALRERYRLPAIGDLIDVMLAGDRVLFPDVPWLTPLADPPAHHVFLGPVLWSPDVAPPSWWERSTRESCIYVTLGSSGRVDRLPAVLAGLRGLGRPLVVATAGRCAPEQTPAVFAADYLAGRCAPEQTAPVFAADYLAGRCAPEQTAPVFAADYLPGAEAARRSALVVCNGGSASAYQALYEGRPVLGIASNLDQFLTMDAIAARGAGLLQRASTVTPERIERLARTLLEQPRYHEAAARARRELKSYDAGARFEATLADMLG